MNAHKGDAKAQYKLAIAYENGKGVDTDKETAMKWYQKAADNNLAEAQLRLAHAYETDNDGVKENEDEAMKWYRKAADQGYAEAQYELAQIIEKGRFLKTGMKKDISEAAEWYRKAADQGHAKAKEALSFYSPVDLSAGATEIKVIIPGGVSWKMIKVGAGSFEMSSKDGENGTYEVAHQATLTKDFYIGQTEVTSRQWEALMSRSDYIFSKPQNVSWNDAMEFCEKLNEMGKAPSGWRFSLPTETQWEYAARGGNKSKGYKYSGSNNIDEVAWYENNSEIERSSYSYSSYSSSRKEKYKTNHIVGGKKANELGLYDMSGNMWEWCLDDWNEDSSKQIAEFTRGNDKDDAERVLRGGSYSNNAWSCRSKLRHKEIPHKTFSNGGFRVALVPEKY